MLPHTKLLYIITLMMPTPFFYVFLSSVRVLLCLLFKVQETHTYCTPCAAQYTLSSPWLERFISWLLPRPLVSCKRLYGEAQSPLDLFVFGVLQSEWSFLDFYLILD